ncbi:MAG: hypothetical protein JW902_07940 [Syntrophaceae bacterium]|nr:hypothetical protein [Syntrophaceae bacterium]
MRKNPGASNEQVIKHLESMMKRFGLTQ